MRALMRLMQSIRWLAALALVPPAVLPAQTARAPVAAAPVPAAQPLVFDGVTVIDVEEGRRLRDQRVVIVGHRIHALGRRKTVRMPPGARIVDGRGKFLIPGLWNMHVHFFGPPDVTNWWTIANGVTGIREAGSGISLDTFRVWKQEIAAGTRVGPRMLVSSQAMQELGQPCTRVSTDWLTCVADAADALHFADSLHAAGADMLKLYGLSIPTHFAVAAWARRLGIPFGGHMPWQGSPTGPQLDGRIASDSGERILDHETYFKPSVCGDHMLADTAELDLAQCKAAAQRLRRNDTWITDNGGGVRFRAGAGAIPDSVRQRVERYGSEPLTDAERRVLPLFLRRVGASRLLRDSAGGPSPSCRTQAMMYAANLPLLASSDLAHPGAFIHGYLVFKELCGVPTLWALQTATLNPARAMHLDDSLGTVKQGKVADLVLLDGDPLADLGNVTRIRAVVADGHYFDRPALNRLLAEAQRALKAHEAAEAERAKAAASP